MPGWMFITRHAVVLSLIATNPRITALVISSAIGITERAVRKIIADLYAAGYIRKKREGRGVRYSVNPDMPMRHNTHRHVAVGDLLESLGWKKPGKELKEETAS